MIIITLDGTGCVEEVLRCVTSITPSGEAVTPLLHVAGRVRSR